MSGSGNAIEPERRRMSEEATVKAEVGLGEEEETGDAGGKGGNAGDERSDGAGAERDGGGSENAQEAAIEEETAGGCKSCVGGAEAVVEPLGVDQAEHGLVATSAAVCVGIGAVWLFPSERGEERVLLLLGGYPFVTGLFYLVYRRWGRWLGAPPRVEAAGLVLMLLAWFLAFSDEAALQQMAFLLGQTVLLVCGVSLGGWLAVIAFRNGTGLWGALRIYVRGDGLRVHRVWRRESLR